MSKTRSYYTIEEADGTTREVELTDTAIPTPRSQRPQSSRHTRQSLDPDTGNAITPAKLDADGEAIAMIEKAVKKGTTNPWFLQHELDELREAWYDRPPIEGLPQEEPTEGTRDRASERREIILRLQHDINTSKARWRLADQKKAHHQREQDSQLLQLDDPAIRAQWHEAQTHGWIKAAERKEPWEPGATWTKSSLQNGNGNSQLAFFLGVIYGNDRIITNEREERQTIEQGNLTTAILYRVEEIFNLKKRSLYKARQKQQNANGKPYLDIFDRLTRVKTNLR